MKNIIIAIVLSIFTFSTQAGIAIGGTRFVYEEKDPQLNITLENSDLNSYLIKTKVMQPESFLGAERSRVSPFFATPPLFVLGGGKQSKIRLVSDGSELAKDKESLFDLVITAIPSSDQKEQSNTVQMAMRSHMKLFFRPANLQGNPETAYQKAVWGRTKKGMSVNNPTPFYITLFGVTVNGIAINNLGVVAPFATRTFPLCYESKKCSIQWKSINDFGRILEAKQKDI